MSGARDRHYHAALASQSRRQVLEALQDSPQPLDAPTIAEALGLHVTTARFHLDQLVAAGLVQRRVAEQKSRGRPRMLYAIDGEARDDNSRQQLIEVLADALARDQDSRNESIRAGVRWAESFAPLDPEDPETGLVEVLDRLGFEPRIAPEAILLEGCPFRDAARRQPNVVCVVHSALIDRLLERPEGAPPVLLPFVEPELCLVARGGMRQEDNG